MMSMHKCLTVRQIADRLGKKNVLYTTKPEISLPNLCSDERSALGSARSFGPKAVSLHHSLSIAQMALKLP